MTLDVIEDDNTPIATEFYSRSDEYIMVSRRAVAYSDGQIVGVIWFAAYGAPAIASIYVLATHRRRGIAAELYRFAALCMGVRLDEIHPSQVMSEEARATRRALGMRLE